MKTECSHCGEPLECEVFELADAMNAHRTYCDAYIDFSTEQTIPSKVLVEPNHGLDGLRGLVEHLHNVSFGVRYKGDTHD